MANITATTHKVDQQNGFCSKTKIFHSLRPPIHLPPPFQPLSIIQYAFSLLRSSESFSGNTPFLIDATSGNRLTYSEFLNQINALAFSLRSKFPSLSKNDVAFVLSPPSLHVPVLYFALLSNGVTVSPANPLSTESELTHLFQLTKPVIAFANSAVARKLPSVPLGTVVIDSPEFISLMTCTSQNYSFDNIWTVSQSDTAAILYSSGTTGRIKGVELSHRNLIAVISSLYHNKFENNDSTSAHQVLLFMLPMFHVFGFFVLIWWASVGETVVIMEKFDLEKMLMAVEKYKVTYIPVSPPVVVAMVKSELVHKYDLRSLQLLRCGGASLGKKVVEKFTAKFLNVTITQVFL